MPVTLPLEPAPSRAMHSGGCRLAITLAYRCEGSVGFARDRRERTDFPFHSAERNVPRNTSDVR